MLEFLHLDLKDRKQTHLLHDVSFRFSSVGLTVICSDSSVLHLYLAQILAGYRKPDKGTLKYNAKEITEFKDVELSLYRSSFTASLFSDCQLLENKSVLENIKMGTTNEEDIRAMLKEWGLLGKEKIEIKDLSFLDQMKAILLRILLRKPSVLVVYPDSSPYSAKEWLQLYPYLKKISKQMAVIVIGEVNCYTYSDRIIEIRDGYIISDSTKTIPAEFYYLEEHTSFRIDAQIRHDISNRLNHRFRWRYRLLTIFVLIGFVCLSASIFSTTLDIADIEMMYLEQNKFSTIAIAKHVQGKDDTTYTKSYAPLKDSDVKELQEKMNGIFIESYYPQSPELLNYQSQGKFAGDDFQNYALIETKNIKELDISIAGRYPQNYNEVALNYQDAKKYFNEFITDDGSGKDYIGQQINWFQVPLTVTGIIRTDSNQNLTLSNYQRDAEIYDVSRGSLYVKEGFHKAHAITQQKVFKKSYKRFRNTLTSSSYPVSSFYPINYSTYYSDGKTQYLDLSKSSQQIKDNEVILSFSLALKLGYASTYQSDEYQSIMGLEQKKQSYEQFTKGWIGKTIQVQAYEAEIAPNNTSIFEKNMKIKGFLYPYTWDYDDSYMYDKGILYMNQDVLNPYLEPNYMIKDLYFHTKDRNNMKGALQYLLEQNLYTAYLSKPLLMQFFVIDLKELCVLLAIGGSIALGISIMILLRVLKDACCSLKKEVSVYYMFGEQIKYIKRMYVQYFIDVLSKRILIGWILSTIVIAGYVLVIFFKIVMHSTILYNLFLPLALGILFLICIVIILFIALHKEKLIDEEFTKEM